MFANNPEFLIDNKGNKTKVLLSYDSYLKMLEMIEDLQDSKLIEQTKEETETTLTAYKRKRNLV